MASREGHLLWIKNRHVILEGDAESQKQLSYQRFKWRILLEIEK